MVSVNRKSDSELIANSVQGDPKAFVILIRRHEGLLAAIIKRWVPNNHDAEDILQETLLQAWRSLKQLRHPERLKPWLIRIATNRCRDHLKSGQRRDRATDDAVLETYINCSGRAVRSAGEKIDISEAIVKLKAKQRKLIELFYMKGLTIEEISKRMAKPKGTIKGSLFHARTALRNSLNVRQ